MKFKLLVEEDYMTLGEANWVLWGLALQVGLCPNCRKVLVEQGHDPYYTIQYCNHCYRDWSLHRSTGRCAGWALSPTGWYYDAGGRPVFKEPGS